MSHSFVFLLEWKFTIVWAPLGLVVKRTAALLTLGIAALAASLI